MCGGGHTCVPPDPVGLKKIQVSVCLELGRQKESVKQPVISVGCGRAAKERGCVLECT